jgi:hypothetical protein
MLPTAAGQVSAIRADEVDWGTAAADQDWGIRAAEASEIELAEPAEPIA